MAISLQTIRRDTLRSTWVWPLVSYQETLLRGRRVAAIIRNRKVSQAALVGSSHGGNIALNDALRYPEQISDLVLVGPEAEGFPYSEHFVMAQMELQGAKDPTAVRVENTYFIAP